MIKIERISPDAEVTVDGNRVEVGYIFHGTLLKTLVVKNGEVMYSINEKTIEHKFSPGMQGSSNPMTIAKAAASKELKTDKSEVAEKEVEVASDVEVTVDASEKELEEVEVKSKAKPRKAILGE